MSNTFFFVINLNYERSLNFLNVTLSVEINSFALICMRVWHMGAKKEANGSCGG